MGLNVELLGQSFTLVAPQADELVSRFYERLFHKYPAVTPLFKNASLADQKRNLLASLVLVIQNLRRPDILTEALQTLGPCRETSLGRGLWFYQDHYLWCKARPTITASPAAQAMHRNDSHVHLNSHRV